MSEKKRRPDTGSSSEMQFGSFDVFNSAALTFQHTGQFRKAIDAYTKALELKEGDKNCLICRSQCFLRAGDADRALQDAVKTLEDDPHYIKGMLQQAEAYYQKGMFEYALMHFHRGQKLRPEKQAFRLGIQKAQEAIDNSIGECANITLTKKGDLSYFYSEEQKSEMKPEKRPGYTKPKSSRSRKKQQERRKQEQSEKTVKQLLGELYADKEYLEILIGYTTTTRNQTNTTQAVQALAKDALNYLDTRTEFWQQQCPLHCRQNRRNPQRTAVKKKNAPKEMNMSEWILQKLSEIDEAQAQGRFEDALKVGKRTLRQVERILEVEIPNRLEIVANLHSCLGNSYLELADYNLALHHHNLDNEIGKQNDIEEAISRSLDNIGRVYARMGQFEKAIHVWQEKEPMVSSALEGTWLFHELGRCHLELDHFDQARDYGEKSLDAAEEAEDEIWQLNATVLIAQCQVKTKEYQAALDSFDQALDMARLQNDEAAKTAIRRAKDDVNSKIVEQMTEEKRKKKEEYDAGGTESSDKDTKEEQSGGERKKSAEKNQERKDKEDDEDLGEEKTVETQVSKDKNEDKQEKSEPDYNNPGVLTTTDNNDSSDRQPDAVNENRRSEPSPPPRDNSFWEKYNDAVDDKVKYGEITQRPDTRQKKRNRKYGYPAATTASTSTTKVEKEPPENTVEKESSDNTAAEKDGTGFSKDYQYDFEATKSKFEHSQIPKSGSDGKDTDERPGSSGGK